METNCIVAFWLQTTNSLEQKRGPRLRIDCSGNSDRLQIPQRPTKRNLLVLKHLRLSSFQAISSWSIFCSPKTISSPEFPTIIGIPVKHRGISNLPAGRLQRLTRFSVFLFCLIHWWVLLGVLFSVIFPVFEWGMGLIVCCFPIFPLFLGGLWCFLYFTTT